MDFFHFPFDTRFFILFFYLLLIVFYLQPYYRALKAPCIP